MVMVVSMLQLIHSLILVEKTYEALNMARVGPQLNSSYTGGNYYYVITTETNFDLPIDEYDISSSLFLDVGSVWGLDERYGSIDDKHKMRASVGLNLIGIVQLDLLILSFLNH